MKKTVLPIVLCWVLIGLIFFTFTILPMMLNRFLTGPAPNEGSTFILAFYSLFLCHPYLRVVQFYANQSKFMETRLPPFSEYRKNHMVLEYVFGKAIYILGGIVVMFLALSSAFGRIMLYHYLAVLLYGISLVLLEIGISNRN